MKKHFKHLAPVDEGPDEFSIEAIFGEPKEEVFDPEGLNQYRIIGEAYMIDQDRFQDHE